MTSQPDLYPLRPLRRRAVSRQRIAVPPPAPETDEIGLAAHLRVLRDNLRLVGAVAAAVTLVALAYALLARPVFEASMLIHVEEVNPAGARNALNEMASMFDTKKTVTAEMELLRSRAVLAPAVERLKLYVDARPASFALASLLRRESRPAEERIAVALFNVPPGMYAREFVVTSLGGDCFSVYEEHSNIIFYGRVGQLLRADTPAGLVELRLARLAGTAGERFLLSRTSMMAAIKKLQRDLIIAEQGRQSGVIEVRLESRRAELADAVLHEIGAQYIAQNQGRKSEEAEKSLAFLELQLPKLKARLEQAEGEYNAFRHANGTIDFAEEARLSLQQAAAARLRRTELMQKKTELLTRFTRYHPTVAAVAGQLRQIDQESGDIARHIKSLPLLEQDALRLSREIKVDTDLYTALANTAQQLRVVSVGKASNVRMIDPPMAAYEPVRPHRTLVVLIGAVCGLLLGAGAAFVRRDLAGGVDDPVRIEQLLGSRVVFASIPHSEAQARIDKRGAIASRQALLAQDWPNDGAIEALRSFRASLQFSMPRFDNNVIVFAGPTSSLGKSFVTANFAAVMAAGGKRVLLVDADVRNGRLHQYFGAQRAPGLCEALAGAMPPGPAIRRDVLPNLDFIPTGRVPERPDFFVHSGIGALLASLGAHYDLVLVDSPPILALADALLIGSQAGAVFLVVRAGVSTEREITESIKRLGQAGVAPCGIVFNDVKPRLSGYGYKYAYQKKQRLAYDG
jgi:tyrosine-protein kinase Etk/Wzc